MPVPHSAKLGTLDQGRERQLSLDQTEKSQQEQVRILHPGCQSF